MCGDFFVTKDNLKDHILREQGIKDHKCDECDAKFVTKGELRNHIKRNACWFTDQNWLLWEILCVDEFARLILNNMKWVSYPKIDTQEIDGKSWIKPEIVVENSDGTTSIIDAKRTQFAIDVKDIEIYPRYADKVIFWCLFGESKTLEINKTTQYFVSAEELISKIQETSEEKEVIDLLTQKVALLRKGQDYRSISV